MTMDYKELIEVMQDAANDAKDICCPEFYCSKRMMQAALKALQDYMPINHLQGEPRDESVERLVNNAINGELWIELKTLGREDDRV